MIVKLTAPIINSNIIPYIDIVSNKVMIIIKTTPGAASLIARVIDHKSCHVLGTVAGDDVVFVAPQSIHAIAKTMALERKARNAPD